MTWPPTRSSCAGSTSSLRSPQTTVPKLTHPHPHTHTHPPPPSIHVGLCAYFRLWIKYLKFEAQTHMPFTTLVILLLFFVVVFLAAADVPA